MDSSWPVYDMPRLRRQLRYTDLKRGRWHTLCAHLKRFGQEVIVGAGLSLELDYDWRTHHCVLLKASEAFYKTFGTRYWPDSTFGEISTSRKQEHITWHLKYLLYEINHQDYRISGTRRRSARTSPGHELQRTDQRSTRLRRSGRIHARYRSNLPEIAYHEGGIKTEGLVDGRFFSLRHRELSGIHDCGSDTDEQENVEDKDVDVAWGIAGRRKSPEDAEEQLVVAELGFRSLREQLLTPRGNLTRNALQVQRVPRKPLAKHCGICQDGYGPTDVTAWCEYGCGQSIHSRCFEQWQGRQSRTTTCICCRQSWFPD